MLRSPGSVRTHTIAFGLEKNSIPIEYPTRSTTDISTICQISNCPSLCADNAYIRIRIVTVAYKFKSEPFTIRRPFVIESSSGVIPCRTIRYLTYLFCFQIEYHQTITVFDKSKADKEKSKVDSSKDSNQDESADDKADQKEILVELNGIEDRIVRLTPNSSDLGSAILSKDGEDLYYFSAFEGGYDLWKMNLREKDTKRLHKLNTGWASLMLDKKGDIFLLGSRIMQKMDAKSDALKSISYQAEMKMDLAAERETMFDHVYKQHQKRFYNVNMHGVDWDAMTNAYRKFLPHIDNNYDFAELLSEWLGELNVSHTGGRYSPKGKGDVTSNLGLLFDWDYQGKGMQIAEIIEKGPFDHSRTKVKAGCIIEKINREEINLDNDITCLLNNKAGKKTLISIYNPQNKERWEEVVMPVTNGQLNGLLYKRWVKQRAADVEKWSKGRLGYVHIQSMGDDSFRTVYSDILGKYNNCEGIVIDTRFNGGGRLHEDIEILFSGQKYFTQVVRGREACDMPSRRWNKPSIMLQCEANYSNAHGTPWVYKHQKIGKLVGMPVPIGYFPNNCRQANDNRR